MLDDVLMALGYVMALAHAACCQDGRDAQWCMA